MFIAILIMFVIGEHISVIVGTHV